MEAQRQQKAAQHDPRDAIAVARRMRRQSQEGLARALSIETGEEWTRVMVGNLEAGRKILDVDTLMAIAKIQGLPCSFYLEPFPGTIRTIPGYFNPQRALEVSAVA